MSVRVEMDPALLNRVKSQLSALLAQEQQLAATPFTEEAALVGALKKAGLPVEKTHGRLRSAVGELTVGWRRVDGRYHAVLPRGLAPAQTRLFLEKLSQAAGAPVGISAAGAGEGRCFPTPFTDMALLEQALRHHGGHLTPLEENVAEAVMEGVALRLEQQEDGAVMLRLPGHEDPLPALARVELLARDYGLLVQRRLLEDLKAQLPAQQWSLMQEETLPDGSIVLTLNVDGG